MARYISTLLQNDTCIFIELLAITFNSYTYIHTTIVSCCWIEGAGWAHILLSGTEEKTSNLFQCFFVAFFYQVLTGLKKCILIGGGWGDSRRRSAWAESLSSTGNLGWDNKIPEVLGIHNHLILCLSRKRA
jgi:hypothetical protein